jgi:hypothetical protein
MLEPRLAWRVNVLGKECVIGAVIRLSRRLRSIFRQATMVQATMVQATMVQATMVQATMVNVESR